MRLASIVALALVASPFVASVAAADDTKPAKAAAAGPGVVYVLPTQTVYGRPDKPMVQVFVKTPTAAQAAGAAHESLRQTLMAQSMPAGLKQ